MTPGLQRERESLGAVHFSGTVFPISSFYPSSFFSPNLTKKTELAGMLTESPHEQSRRDEKRRDQTSGIPTSKPLFAPPSPRMRVRSISESSESGSPSISCLLTSEAATAPSIHQSHTHLLFFSASSCPPKGEEKRKKEEGRAICIVNGHHTSSGMQQPEKREKGKLFKTTPSARSQPEFAFCASSILLRRCSYSLLIVDWPWVTEQKQGPG